MTTQAYKTAAHNFAVGITHIAQPCVMATGTVNAIVAIMAQAEAMRETLAALELCNAASHLVDNSPFFGDAAKAVMNDAITSLYFDLKSFWKDAA